MLSTALKDSLALLLVLVLGAEYPIHKDEELPLIPGGVELINCQLVYREQVTIGENYVGGEEGGHGLRNVEGRLRMFIEPQETLVVDFIVLHHVPSTK